MKQINGHQFIQLFEQFSPKKYALEHDPIGLQIGTLNKQMKNVLVTLDVTEDVVKEAIAKQVDLIIAHHPFIFRPLKRVTTDDFSGKIVEMLIKHDITLYAAHTNLDVAPGGVNDLLAEALQLKNTEVLVPTYEEKFKKLVVYVPETHQDELIEALGNIGAGHIGQYSHCSFSTQGIGRFKPGNDTNPYIGKVNEIAAVEEVKIETVFPERMERKVINRLLQVHPYEEPAYDIYVLDVKGEELGLGRIGRLEKEMTLEQFAKFTKGALHSNVTRMVGDPHAIVKKVAVLGGDGNKYFQTAKFKGADVYVTGDIYFHTAHDAINIGLNMIDPGHHVEHIMKYGVKSKMESLCKENGFDVTIIASSLDTDPFTMV